MGTRDDRHKPGLYPGVVETAANTGLTFSSLHTAEAVGMVESVLNAAIPVIRYQNGFPVV